MRPPSHPTGSTGVLPPALVLPSEESWRRRSAEVCLQKTRLTTSIQRLHRNVCHVYNIHRAWP